jgi:hypothetical protein
MLLRTEGSKRRDWNRCIVSKLRTEKNHIPQLRERERENGNGKHKAMRMRRSYLHVGGVAEEQKLEQHEQSDAGV